MPTATPRSFSPSWPGRVRTAKRRLVACAAFLAACSEEVVVYYDSDAATGGGGGAGTDASSAATDAATPPRPERDATVSSTDAARDASAAGAEADANDARADAAQGTTTDAVAPSDAIAPVDGRVEAGADGGGACTGRPFGASCAEGFVCDGQGECAIRRPCKFDSVGRWLLPEGAGTSVVESVFAYGRYFNFYIRPSGVAEPLNPGGTPTASVARWRGAGAPCGSSDPCTLDTYNLWASGGAGAMYETVLREGRFYTYATASGYQLASSGLIESVPQWTRTANGPCAGQPPGACRFDTRSLVTNWAASQLVRDEITALGRRWVYDGAGRPVPSVPLGQPLAAVPRYAPGDGQGPCSGVALCKFDAHFHDPTTGDEYVIARGRLFSWAGDAENTRRFANGHGNELHTFARYATGPCRVAR